MGQRDMEFAQLTDPSKLDGTGDIDGRMAIKDVFTELAALPPLQRQALLRTSLDGESTTRSRARSVSRPRLYAVWSTAPAQPCAPP
jgi:hypothetical protein